MLPFACDPHVAFTNNRAEQDLRMAKVKQKVSGCLRTERYAQAYCRISSYLQTMANRGINPLVAIQIALAGEIGGEYIPIKKATLEIAHFDLLNAHYYAYPPTGKDKEIGKLRSSCVSEQRTKSTS